MKKTLILLSFAFLASAGCFSGSHRLLSHKDIEYVSSGLDWIEMIYIPKRDDARFETPIRLSFSAKGQIVAAHGRSPLVLNSMSTDVDDPNWNAVREERLYVSEKEWKEIVQAFIDEGLVPRRGRTRTAKGKALPRVRYAGTLGFDRFSGETDNARFLDLVEDFLETNFGPALKKR